MMYESNSILYRVSAAGAGRMADDTALPPYRRTPLTVTAEIGVPDAARTMAPTVPLPPTMVRPRTFVTADRRIFARTRGGSSSARWIIRFPPQEEVGPFGKRARNCFLSREYLPDMYPADYRHLCRSTQNKTGGGR